MAVPVPLQISVTSSADRLSQREQIEQVLTLAQQKGKPILVRLPFTLYDHTTARGYRYVRDATWNITLPIAQASPEQIEELIVTIGECLAAIAREGSEAVRRKVGEP